VSERRWETRLIAVVALGLSMIGIIAVYGASSLITVRGGGIVGSTFALNQAVGLLVGGLTATIIARLDYHLWERWAWPILGIVVLLLLVPLLPFTYAIAPMRNGARRWVEIAGLSMQPSELAKLAIVAWTAMLAAKKGPDMRSLRRGVVPTLVIVLPVVGLIFLEPNLSMALLVTLLAGVVMFSAGARIGHFLLLAVAAAPLAFGAIATAQYRMARVLTFLNSGSAPTEANWQVHQSLVGIGAGRLLGVGIGHGQQKLGYLPYAYSDFIFSTLGEEWGFLGVLLLAVGFGLFVWLGFRIARSARDPFGQLLAAGLTAIIGIGAVLHIGVSLAVLPATGVTLPFVSYGRSSLLVSLIATGMLISVGQRRTGRAAGE
jgi:cell division protein FtsW